MARKRAGPEAQTVASRRLRLGAAVLALLVALPRAAAGAARANGALPASYGILLPADKPQEIVLATNFGMIISEDAGASWLWTCEQPATSFGYLYGVGPPPRDRFYALSPDAGLAFSDDGSCTLAAGGRRARRRWSRATSSSIAPTRDRVARRRGAGRADDRRHRPAVGVPVDPTAARRSARRRSTPRPPARTSSASRSRAATRWSIYLAMYTTPDRHPRLCARATAARPGWTRDVEAALGANEFRILAVDPDDADVLYLRVIALGMESWR